MNRTAVVFCLVAGVCWAPLRAAEPPKQPQDLAELAKQISALRKHVEEKVAKVDEAISAAVKAGTVKSSTEQYLRENLSRFQGQQLEESFPGRSYTYPPAFDTSVEMEPLNLAWTDLRNAVTEMSDSAGTMSPYVLAIVMEQLRAIVRTAERPEELEPVTEAIEKYRTLLDAPRRNVPSYAYGEPLSASLKMLIDTVRQALRASDGNDLAGLSSALARLVSNPNSAFSRGGMVSIAEDPLWQDFRRRLLEPFRKREDQLQLDLEKAMIARKPVTEIERLLVIYTAYVRNLAQGEQSARVVNALTMRSGPPDVFSRTYRQVLNALATLQRGEAPAEIGTGSSEAAEFASGIEFSRFLAKLNAEGAEIKAKAARERQEAQAREQAEAQARLRKEAEERRAAFLAEVKKRLGEVKSPDQALKLSDELPGLVPAGARRSSEGSDLGETLQVNQVQQELRELAAWWSGARTESGAELLSTEGVGYRGNRMNHGASSEMKVLWDLAFREVAAAKFDVPELLKPPLVEKAPSAALQQLANEAASKADWKRCHQLLSALGMRSSSGQFQAVRAYLTGLNYEKAEEFAQAAAAYRSVLEQLAENIPVQEAADRLKALKKAHPEVFPVGAFPGR